MDINEAKKKLECFKSDDEERRAAITHILVKGGKAYATDGRIAVRVDVGDAQDEIPENYPLAIEDIVAEAEAEGIEWRRLDGKDVKNMSATLLDRIAAEEREIKNSFRERYVEVVCPHCNSYVYYDTEQEKLVEDKCEEGEVRPQDPQVVSVLRLPGQDVPVNFGYVYMALREFGGDTRFALERERPGTIRKVVFMNDGVRGVISPLRDPCSGEPVIETA